MAMLVPNAARQLVTNTVFLLDLGVLVGWEGGNVKVPVNSLTSGMLCEPWNMAHVDVSLDRTPARISAAVFI